MTAAWLTAFLGRLSLREIPVQEEPAPGSRAGAPADSPRR